MSTSIEIGLLGPLVVRRDDAEILIAAPKHRALLALLALDAARAVSADELVDKLWAGRPPESAGTALQIHVSRIRKQLGANVIATRRPGYALDIAPDGVDAHRFERLVADGRSLAAGGDHESAVAVLGQALAIWRGTALAEFVYEDWASAPARRWEELRLVALEDRMESRLELGEGSHLTGELEGLVREHPLRERLRGQQMLALYRAGRQAGALTAYRDARAALVDGLGIDPSPALVDLERRILQQDPALEPPAHANTAIAPAAAPPALQADPRGDRAGFRIASGPAREVRKTVTVLFCDVTGSTELGEALDPEVLRSLLAGFFERMKAIVERHGGTVEKFIGDAVMAVFGVPVVHEDDALRAVRSAVEMREALPELGVEGRIGVMTGEVVSGTKERLATGDAVNVAARLEQAAPVGGVLIGEATVALVRDAADVEQVEPLKLKGKAEPVAAYRLLRVRDTPVREHRHQGPFVGRERELGLLREAWDRVQIEFRCELVTVVGDAGVGKSRLVSEALSRIDATHVGGRCLPYGEAITYWPVVEVLKQLDIVPSDQAALAAIRSLLGETQAPTSVEEIAWAFRKTLEQAATDRPLVVVFDDIQWGEPAFLDLIEHVALLSSGAPLLLCCVCRPELAERRPAWPVTLRLQPLSDEDVDELIGGRVPVELREKIARASAGNPLFIEEMLAMTDEGDGEVVVPPTLQALLAARLDQLALAERSVLERASIEGEIFHRAAIQALAPEETQVTPHLAALVRKQLISPTRPQLAGEDGFRFRHLLIRDAAYDALPKTSRAEYHQRYATWLEQHGTDLVELDEILGYHLEQAIRYQRELALDTNLELTSRAADHLAAAGRGAYARTDIRSATSLLTRAFKFVPIGDARRPMLAVDLAEALTASGLGDPDPLLQEASGDPGAAPYATLARIGWLMESDPEQAATLAERELPGVVKEFESKNDDRGLAQAAFVLGDIRWLEARAQAAAEAWEQAAVHARRANATVILSHALAGIAHVIIEGPLDAEACQVRLTQIEQSNLGLLVEAAVHAGRCGLATLNGEFEKARLHSRACRRLCEDLGLAAHAATAGMRQGRIEIAAGNYPDAISVLNKARDELGDLGGHTVRTSTATAYLARAHQLMGHLEQAEQMALDAEAESAPQDTINFAVAHTVRAEIYAERGDPKAAHELAQSAVEHAFRTDLPVTRGDALVALAHALRADGQAQESADAVTMATACYEQKGDRPSIARAQAFHEPAHLK